MINEALEYMKNASSKLIKGCVAKTNDEKIGLFKPDGNGRYNSVWTRDFAYMVEYASELMDKNDVLLNLTYIIEHASPEGYIPDRVQPDGIAAIGFNRSGFPIGPLLDNGPFLIIAAESYIGLLDEASAKEIFIKWKDVLCQGIDWLPVNNNGIITIDENRPLVGYGFTDTVNKTGAVSKETLLLWKALKLLSSRLQLYGYDADKYLLWIHKIENAFLSTFSDKSGMLYSALGKCHQLDVFASCYMISIGFPVEQKQRKMIAEWLVSNYDGVVEDGQIRHLPMGQYWESTYMNVDKNTYQNGAFWAVATGWFYDSIKEFYPEIARRTVFDVVNYFKTKGIYECVCGEYQRVETYVVSATNVYAALKQILADNKENE